MKIADEYKFVTGGRPCKHDAINQTGGVNEERQRDEPDRRTPQRFGQIEPRKNCEQTGQNVNDHRVVKRLHLVEENFRARFVQCARKIGNQELLQIRQRGIETGDTVIFESIGHRRIIFDRRRNGFAFGRSEQNGSHPLPVAGGIVRRHRQRRFELRHEIEPLQIAGKIIKNGLVVFLSGLLCAHGGDAGGNQVFVISQFLFPIPRVLRLDCVFKLRVKQEPVMDFYHGVLVGIALRRRDFFHAQVFLSSESSAGAIWFHE